MISRKPDGETIKDMSQEHEDGKDAETETDAPETAPEAPPAAAAADSAAPAPEADSAAEALMGPAAEGEELELLEGADADAAAGLDAEIAGLTAEVAELKDKLLRAMAETENMRRRAQREKEDASKYAIAGFAADMVSVADNLDRALASVAAEARAADPALDALMTGVEMTARDLSSSFERNGIRAIEAEGKRFDHNLHEAMFEIENPDIPAGTVLQVVQGGYTINGRLLRPAKVGVSKGGAKPDAPAEAAEAPAETKAEGMKAYQSDAAGAGGQLDEEL